MKEQFLTNMLKVYTDGACSGNPGLGGWAFVIPKLDVEVSDYQENTTNNRMEIIAVIKALEYVKKHFFEEDKIEIITDSQYVVNTMTKGWQKKKNVDLWNCLDEIISVSNEIKWTWVKGHAENKHNQRCDELAVQEYKNFQTFIKSQKEEEMRRELEWYGEKVKLDTIGKIVIEYAPHEKWFVGKGHYVIIHKCTCDVNSYVAEADSKRLLCVGDYRDCKQAVQCYKELVENDFRTLPF